MNELASEQASAGPHRVANFIGGEWAGAASGRTFARENPAATSEVVAEAPDSGAGDVAQAVEQVAAGRHAWS
ncbi:MAG: hypothetical protein J2P25_18560, partial [Nocardiopsaceae bacterium]|nr:hypothetical protein [Nocardiopsaceae bacterium]